MVDILFSRSLGSLRWQPRSLSLLALWGLLLLALAGVLCERILSNSFGAAEARAAAQRAEQVLRAFDADLQQLAIAAHDYAEWDTAAQFVTRGDPEFVRANFVPNTMEALHVELAWLRDATGRTVYSGWYDKLSGRVVEPAPAALLAPLAAEAYANNPVAGADALARIVSTPQGPMAFALREIRRSDRSGATGATLVFARRVDEELLRRVRATSRLPARLRPLTAQDGFAGAVRAWVGRAPSGATTVQVANEHDIDAYALLRDRAGAPALLFTVREPREIHALGVSAGRLLLACVAVLFLLFGGSLLFLLGQLQAAKRRTDRRYRDVAAHLGEAILLVDPASLRIVEANEAVFRLLGYHTGELAQLDIQQIFPGLDAELLARVADEGGEGRIVTSRTRRKDGTLGDTELSITQLREGRSALVVMVGRDVSHRRAALEEAQENERKLIHLAQHDSLTGLPNRLYLRTRLPALLQKLTERERGLVLIYLDVDQFKAFNDSRGHAFGDRMLQVVARRLRNVVGEHDSVVRMGGDEFVLVLTMQPEREAIEAAVGRLREALSEPLHIDGTDVMLTASMGIAQHPQDGMDMDVLLKHADIALYLAKDAGRNCHRYFKANMEVRVSEDMALEQSLRHALGGSEFSMDYQPVVDLATNRVRSLEALLRWRHPDLGMVPPARFIPVAERSGMIVPLGEQALDTVLMQLRDWQAARVPCVPVAVNVSALQLERSDFAARVAERAAALGVEPRWLQFEITESALLREQERIVAQLSQLRELGCLVYIDDFGTGYSALSYLHRLPVDGLKIDRSFVVEMARNGGQSAIIAAIVKIARELRLHVVVEGVETAEQLMMLREYHCAAAQGFFFSKPIPVARCTRLLQRLDDVQRTSESTTVRVLRGSDLSLAG